MIFVCPTKKIGIELDRGSILYFRSVDLLVEIKKRIPLKNKNLKEYWSMKFITMVRILGLSENAISAKSYFSKK